jgi:two-component system KDP operon response regulator KdpE
MKAENHRPGKVLIVEDEAPIRRFLRISLEAHGFTVIEARLGEEGVVLCSQEQPELVVLDLGLPDIDGQEVIARIREWSKVPIVVLSVRSDEREKVAALDRGANDYVTKPFGISEFMARIRVCLRSRESTLGDKGLFRLDDLEIDLARRRVRVAMRDVRLSKKEYELLRLLVTHPDQVMTHEHILREIWGVSHASDTHYLRVLVGHLRQKLGEQPTQPRFIQTVQGVGYRLSTEE